MDHRDDEQGAVESDAVVLHVLLQLFFRHMPVYQGKEKVLPQEGQTLQIILLQPLYGPAAVTVLVQLYFDLLEDAPDLSRVNGLEQIFLRAQTDRFLGILELIETGENDDPDIGIQAPEPSRQFQTVHIGHLDIRHDHIRLQFFRHL